MISASLCLLTACLEVKDDSNSDVAQAIEAQNEILSETKESNPELRTVALTGLIVNAFDHKEVSSASITVIAADEVIREDLVFANGEFKIDDLPSSSDITLIVSSGDDSFLTRVFFINTGYSATANTPNDIGNFEVSEANNVQVSVINKTTGLPLPSLEFTAYSHYGNSSRANKYKHISVYDEANGVYKISVPKYLNISVAASLDVNQDGEADYTPESSSHSSGNGLNFSSGISEESFTLYIEEIAPLAEV